MMPSMETMLTMVPRPASSIARPTSWLRAKAAVRLTSRTSPKRSGDSASAGSGVPTPALLTRMSTRPKRSSVEASSRSRSLASTTSHGTDSPSISLASASIRSARRAATTTDAPAPARTCAKRAPRPLDAPVTIATRPLSRKGSKTSTRSGEKLADQHRLQASRSGVADERGEGGDRAGVAEVEADDRAGLQPSAHAGLDGGGAGVEIVAGVDVEPAHDRIARQAGLVHDDLRVVGRHARGPEVGATTPGLRLEHVAATDDLAADGGHARAAQLRMRVGVVLQLVAGVEDGVR